MTAVFKLLVWWRFVDYIFVMAESGRKIKGFFGILSCYHRSIKFTSINSGKQIDFLDGEVIKEDN